MNGTTAYRKAEYFQSPVGTNNSSAPAWFGVTVASGGNTNTGNIFVAKTPETFGYDADGNTTNDGRFTYAWDAENRLISAVSLTNTPTASQRKVTWQYDGKGRRIRQTTYDGSSGSYVVTEDLKFVSDGWRHIAELNATNDALVRSYVWGLDLSGSLNGAGGIGGLLMMNSAANGSHFYTYDGNGNVAALVKATDGTISANYEYEAFGRPIRATGLMSKENPFRFSTKRMDNTTDLVLYEVRPYSPSLGGFLTHDPLEEQGGLNLYAFCDNNPNSNIDPNGAAKVSTYTIIFTTGRGLSHALLGCVYCHYCSECTARATAQIQNAQGLFGENLEGFENWLRAARPGTECGELCASCTEEYLFSMRWFYGSVALKYGVKIFGS